MRENKLKMVLRLFALVATINFQKNFESIKKLIGYYLDDTISENKILNYERIFNFYYQLYSAKLTEKREKVIAMLAVKLIRLSHELRKELFQQEKSKLVLLLFVYLKNEFIHITANAVNTISIILSSLGIDECELEDIRNVLMQEGFPIKRKDAYLKIKNFKDKTHENIEYKWIDRDQLKGEFKFYFLKSIKLYLFMYNGNDELYLNGHRIITDIPYLFETGSIIHGSRIKTINYGDIHSLLSGEAIKNPVSLISKSASYKYKGSKNGIEDISLQLSSGEFVGILGASGTGKTTLLRLLNGSIVPDSGSVIINGHDIHEEQESLKGIIGYIPQEDYLIDDLTVFNNLYFEH